MTYISLLSQIEPHIGKSRAELPPDIVQMLVGHEERFKVVQVVINDKPHYGEDVKQTPGRAPNLYAVWDELSPVGRKHLATQHDAQHDPANEELNAHHWSLCCEIDAIQEAIRERELMVPQNYSELEARDKKLAELRTELTALNKQLNDSESSGDAKHGGSGNKGITKQQVLTAFESLWPHGSLKNALEDGPKWIADARVRRGKRGSKHQSMWQPVILAVALCEYKKVSKSQLNKAFYEHEFLADWRDEWKELSGAMF